MNILQRFELWGDNHHPKWLDIIRIALGLFLIYKGIDFLRNMGILTNLMKSRSGFGDLAYMIIGHFIVFAHIIGGGLIALGLYTRLACLVQIPILLCAIIFINLGGDMARPYSEFFLSVIILLLFIYFAIVGNGPLSVHLKEDGK